MTNLTTVKKYRLGNQPAEYEVKKDYLGWLPENNNWWDLIWERKNNMGLTIINPKDESRKLIFFHRFIIKDAFPSAIYMEDWADDLNYFAIVSDDETSEKYIIPILLA